jgi:hypothetical protein
MKAGICKEYFSEVYLNEVNLIGDEIYECPKCFYPNGIKCGDFHEIYKIGELRN